MTDKNYTHIVAILDRSGSMQNLADDTIGGFNSFVKEQRKSTGRATITRVQFDDRYQVDYENVDINDCELLDGSSYQPRGMTALFDAVGKTVNSVGQYLSSLPENKRPGQVVFVVITDGFENSSVEFKDTAVREMVKHQIDKYSWDFVYLGGGDLSAQQQQAAMLGVTAANAYNYTANAAGTKAVYGAVSSSLTRRRGAVAKGLTFDASTDSLLDDDEAASLIVEE